MQRTPRRQDWQERPSRGARFILERLINEVARDVTDAKDQIAVAAEVLVRCAEQVEKAAEILEQAVAE